MQNPNILNKLWLVVIFLIAVAPAIVAYDNPTYVYGLSYINESVRHEVGDNIVMGGAIQWPIGINFNASSGFADTTYLKLPQQVLGSGLNSFSLSFWMKKNSSGQVYVLSKQTAVSDTYILLSDGGVNDEIQLRTGTSTRRLTTTSIPDSFPYTLFTWVYDGATVAFYMNSSLVSQDALSGPITSSNQVYLGDYLETSGGCTSCSIDELYFYNNTALSTTNISSLYNTGLGFFYPFVRAGDAISIQYPSNNQVLRNNTDGIYVYGNVSAINGNLVNYTWTNDTRFVNIKTNVSFNFTPNTSLPGGEYYFTVFSKSNISEVINKSVIFSIDTVPPNITSSIDANRSIFYGGGNISFQINFTDDLLVFSFNISTPEGFVTNHTNVNQTKYIYNASFNTSTYNVGKHNVTIEVCDAHTANSIEEYTNSIDSKNNKISFSFQENTISIYPENKTKITDASIEKKTDRYNFYFTQDKTKKDGTLSFIVESSNKIEIVGNQKGYYGWIVIPALKKWIDFNNIYSGEQQYTIERITDKKIRVVISNIYQDIIEFNSIGDLNCVSNSYSYYLYNYTAIYEPALYATQSSSVTLNIDHRGLALAGSNGALFYSNQSYSTTKTSSSDSTNFTSTVNVGQLSSNLTTAIFYWNYTLNQTDYSTNNFSQTQNNLLFVVCPNYNASYLNISIFDENSPTTYIESDVRADLNFWTNDSSVYLNQSFILTSQTNYSLCLNYNTTIHASADFIYNTTGGYAERWFLTNTQLNPTKQMYLYNFQSTSGISELRGILRDESYSYYPDIITKLQRRYVGENIWRTVQMDKSDENGQINYHVIESSQDYQVLFEYGGQQIDQTSTLKFLCTSGICSITFVVIPTVQSINNDLQYEYGFDNQSQIFQVNFTDSTGLTSNLRLLITKETGESSTTICDNSVSASTGSISCNITGYTGTIKAQIFAAHSPSTPQIIIYIQNQIEKLYQVAGLSKFDTGLYATFISSALIIAGSTINPIGGIIMFIISLIATNALGISNFITISVITVMAVLGIVASLMLKR